MTQSRGACSRQVGTRPPHVAVQRPGSRPTAVISGGWRERARWRCPARGTVGPWTGHLETRRVRHPAQVWGFDLEHRDVNRAVAGLAREQRHDVLRSLAGRNCQGSRDRTIFVEFGHLQQGRVARRSVEYDRARSGGPREAVEPERPKVEHRARIDIRHAKSSLGGRTQGRRIATAEQVLAIDLDGHVVEAEAVQAVCESSASFRRSPLEKSGGRCSRTSVWQPTIRTPSPPLTVSSYVPAASRVSRRTTFAPVHSNCVASSDSHENTAS